jgi:aryl-alcohol dehydrogenase-like predicted oxidoreductase
MSAIAAASLRTGARTVELPIIGRTACRVGFGTGGLLRIGNARRRQDVLAAALASGITHFDTAPLYGFGESERALGRFLRGGRRNQVTLTTKFGLQPSALAARLVIFQSAARRAIELVPALRRAAVRNASVLQTPPHFSQTAAMRSLEKSLRALRTDHVDFFLAHQASAASMPEDDLIDWLETVKREGKISAFGVATDFDCILPVLRQRPRLSQVVQFDSNPTRRPVNDGLVPGRIVITYGFIGRAIIACRERVPSWRHVAEDELGGILLRAAVLANPNGIVLMQSRSIQRIEHNVRAATSADDDERVSELLKQLDRICDP